MIATLACIAAIQTSPTDVPVLLRRDVVHRASHAFRMSYRMVMKLPQMPGMPGGQDVGDQPISMVSHFKTQSSPLGGKRAKLKVSFSDGEMEMPMTGSQKLPIGKAITMIVDELGRVTLTKRQNPGVFSGMGLSNSPYGMSATFPERPVRYGDSWPMTVLGGEIFPGGFTMQATYLGEEACGSTPCWRTMITADMDLGKMLGALTSKGGGPMAGLSPKGLMTVSGYTLISKEDGDVVNSDATAYGTFDLEAQGQPVSMKLKISVQVTRIY